MIQNHQNSQVPLAVINPGFEHQDPLAGWETVGIVEAGGYESPRRLTHPGGIGPVESLQKLNQIPNGWYTLRVWVCTSGSPKEVFIALKDCGEAARAAVPNVEEKWLQVVVSAHVTNHQCTISLYSAAEAGAWVSFDHVEVVPGRAALSVLGADISSLKKSEDMGGIYADEHGTEADALKILRDHGMNCARLRVWVNSPDGYHGKAQVLEMARRIKQHNMKLLIDFHYADTWADPGKQPKPAAWADLDLEGLKQALYDHTFEICSSLVEQGTPPDIVQVGNEISNGMLWPDCRNDVSFDHLAALLVEGYHAVKDSSPDTQVLLHVDNGGNNQLCRWWFDSIIAHKVPFDLIGVSYYPYYHGSLYDLQNNLNDLVQRYERDIIVVETSYAFTADDHDNYENIICAEDQQAGYPFSPAGQKHILADIMAVVRAVPNHRGLGVLWWDATWTAVTGNGWDPADPTAGNNWENQALFDFDNRALPAMSLFLQP
ncbi:MAG: arabinogalactan endo-beta-1,4-galactanase [Anaerolineales bacterium]